MYHMYILNIQTPEVGLWDT